MQASAYLMDVAERDTDGKPFVAVDISSGPRYRVVIAAHDTLERLEELLTTVRNLYPEAIATTLSDLSLLKASGTIGASTDA